MNYKKHKNHHFLQRRVWTITKYLGKPGATDGGGKLFWGNEKNPGAIAHELSLLSIEPGIKPITTVDGADRTQVMI